MKKKVCMLGTSAVGKTSLVRRYVEGTFSDRYLTTMGVKIDKKTVAVGERQIDLLVWDLNGEDRFQTLSMDYVQGAAGYLLVIDGTRRATLETALSLQARVEASLGPRPFLVLLNKSDLRNGWLTRASDLDALRDQGWEVVSTSAKTGSGVEAAFTALAARLLDAHDA